MSAAESADPTMHRPGGGGGEAAVIDIGTRVRSGSQGRWRQVSEPQPGRPGGDSPHRHLAEHVETTFNHHHLSLTDEMTSTAYAVTLQIVRGLLDGAVAQDIISGEQRAELDVLIKGVAAAPRLV